MAGVLTWPGGRAVHPSRRPAAGAVAAYVLGCTAGGAAAGLAIASVATAATRTGGLSAHAMALAALAGALALARLQWAGHMGPLPQRRQQVPRRWLLWRSRAATAGAFGLIIGAGVLTPVKYAAAYALAALLVLAPSPAAGALVGAAYGFSRGATLGVVWLGDRLFEKRVDWPARLTSWRRLDQMLAVTALASVAASLFLYYY